MAESARRRILNTGTNKYQSAVRQMQRAIYSDNVYVSLNARSITTAINNDLANINAFWMCSCFMQRIVRDNYRLCFFRTNWQKSTIYDRYDPQQDAATQNCYVFDPTIGDGVLFLCVGNNQYNRTDIRTASTIKPSAGYVNVNQLPTDVIIQEDGYAWIALAQSDPRFTDSSWTSLEVRDGINFFAADRGNYVNDGVTLANFKAAVCSPFSAGETGAAGFYPVENSYNQTNESEVSAGNLLYSVGNMERFDAFKFQQSLKIAGTDSQIRFVTGSTTGATASLPASTTIIPLYEQIVNSPFTTSSPLGWYNEQINGWKAKAGSVEMVWLDTAGISASRFLVGGTAEPSISAKGNGTSPSAEFITRRINESTWEIQGVKISTDLSTGDRLVGKDNTNVEFVVTNTNNDNLFEEALRTFITPYGGLLTEENLYGPIIPVNSFMTSVTINESDITNTLDNAAAGISSPTAFDSYGLVVNAQNYSNSRELGLDLPPNKTEFLRNMLVADFTPSSGAPNISVGDLIYETTPSVTGSAPRGDLIGIIQAIEIPAPISGNAHAGFSTVKPTALDTGKEVSIGRGSSFKTFTVASSAASKTADTKALTGTIMHIGKSNFDITSGSQKRISIKYITRV